MRRNPALADIHVGPDGDLYYTVNGVEIRLAQGSAARAMLDQPYTAADLLIDNLRHLPPKSGWLRWVLAIPVLGLGVACDLWGVARRRLGR